MEPLSSDMLQSDGKIVPRKTSEKYVQQRLILNYILEASQPKEFMCTAGGTPQPQLMKIKRLPGTVLTVAILKQASVASGVLSA